MQGIFSKYSVLIFILITYSVSAESECSKIYGSDFSNCMSVDNLSYCKQDDVSEELVQLNNSLRTLLISGDYSKCRPLVDRITRIVERNINDRSTISESYYFIGIYYSYTRAIQEAIRYMKLCIELKDQIAEFDERYTRALYNLGVFYSILGDFKRHEDYTLKALELKKKISGESSPLLIDIYLSIITAYIELQEYEKSISYSNTALLIGNNNTELVPVEIMAGLYNNLGTCYFRLADLSKAIIFFEKSESIYSTINLEISDNYINLLNNLAIAYGKMGLNDISSRYYEKGISYAATINSVSSFNFINSYSIILGNKGNSEKGISLLSDALEKARTKFGENSHIYYSVLNNYANYLREYKIDINKSLVCYRNCINYLNQNNQDNSLRNLVYMGYSLALADAGDFRKALETIQSVLISDYGIRSKLGVYENPSIETLTIDSKTLKILSTKYKILWSIYSRTPDRRKLEAASNTAELIVSLLEKLRINISDEESRLLLGDNFRDSYLNAIRDFNLLYSESSENKFLEKSFEYMEKSKVAGLLASTRELKATQFHIPSDIADFERRLQRDMSFFNARIDEETTRIKPDTGLIRIWNDNLLKTARLRDSLIFVFEKNYPGYYSLKYNTSVVTLNEIPEIVGRRGNYLNYVISDSILYIFVSNRKHQKLLALNIDSSFFENLLEFRSFLTKPASSANVKNEFEKYQSVGNELCKILIDHARPYFISDELIISPDNILSYIPFETIPTQIYSGEKIKYGSLAYLMNDFNISYVYSATFNAESSGIDLFHNNKVIAFAPNYSVPVDIQNVLMNRQVNNNVLLDLPFARDEAEYVADITDGTLYINEEATESVYKSESGKFDIVHMAMHTILNDKTPMHSTLLFSQESDSTEDGYLKTYEVYGIPLIAKMVVLSSCNTGAGLLSSGEGILSLARGFIYSGSRSVVMSMWEIEDKSGTEIVKKFYKNLKRGYSKSRALKKARIAFLKNADQLRSHPYFWSALVIYGNNSPLYYSGYITISLVIAGLIIILLIVFYLRKRKYS